MADRAVIALPAAILVSDDFGVLALVDDFSRDARAGEILGHLRRVAVDVKEEVRESRGATNFEVEFFNVEDITLGDAVLFTAGFEDCVGHKDRKAGVEKRTASLPRLGEAGKGKVCLCDNNLSHPARKQATSLCGMKADAPSELEYRKALTSVQPGDHLCLIHSGREELLAAVLPLLQAGLERGERCIYVADHHDIVDSLRVAFGKERRTLETAIEAGRLQVLTSDQVYLDDGQFEAEQVVRFWREMAGSAASLGFSGLRVFGEMKMTSHEVALAERVLDYELKLNALVREIPTVVICLYDRNCCAPGILQNALRTHPLVIYGEVVSRNPYYIPPEEMHSPDRAMLEVDRLLEKLNEREQAQARIRETQDRFTAFMDHLPAFAWIKDLEGRYLFINELLREVPSHNVGWQGKTDADLWPPEVAADFRASDARVIAERTPVQVLEPYQLETGEVRYGLVTKFPIFDRTGRMALVGGTSVDITPRIRAEQALRESEERFRQLAENIHEIFWIQNVETGRLEYVSPAFEQIWRLPAAAIMADPKAWMERIHPDDYATVLKHHSSPHSERENDHSFRIVWPDGTIRWIRDRAFPVRDAANRVTRIVGLAEDVTDAVKSEQALRRAHERLQMVSRRLFEVQELERRHLARELHDEIGQALTAAKINLKTAGATNPEAAALLSDTASILDGLLGKVREISLNLRPSMLDDLGLVPALRSLFDQQTRRGGLALQFYSAEVPEILEPEMKIACFRIAQEAITNVLRHAGARAVSLEMWLEDEELRLTITDNGRGFPTAQFDQPGQQAASFGLMGIKERAELAGGVALILSTPGIGTIVDVRLPLVRKPLPKKE